MVDKAQGATTQSSPKILHAVNHILEICYSSSPRPTNHPSQRSPIEHPTRLFIYVFLTQHLLYPRTYGASPSIIQL